MGKMKKITKYLKFCFANMGYFFYFTILLILIGSGINPYDKFTWRLEVMWMFPALFIIAVLWYKKIEFSWLLKVIMFIQSLLLIYGGYYSYEFAPMGEWMKEAFGFTRNHYDRIGHFTQGFFPAIMYREMFVRSNATNGKFWTETFVFAACLAFSAFFEIVEFGAAYTWGSGADAFLGTQGDIWDAQNDMFMCALGALVSIACMRKSHYRILDKFQKRKTNLQVQLQQ